MTTIQEPKPRQMYRVVVTPEKYGVSSDIQRKGRDWLCKLSRDGWDGWYLASEIEPCEPLHPAPNVPGSFHYAKPRKPKRTEADLRALFLSRLSYLWPEHPALEEQYRYASPRKFRADFAHVPSRLLIELEGGVTTHGAHGGRISGTLADLERSRQASAHGWRVFRVCRVDLEKQPDEVVRLLRQAVEGVGGC